MKRLVVLGTLIAAGGLSITLTAFQQPPAGQPDPKVIEVDKLKDNLFVLKGGGGNTAAFVTANGVVIVDTKLPGWGQPLIDKIKTLTDKPVTTIINTHTHFDHVSGNVEFPATVEVITHENTKTYMDQANPVYGLQTGPQTNLFKEKGVRVAKADVQGRLTIGSGAEQIDLRYFGPAHTGGDAFVVFTAASGDARRRHDADPGPADHGQEQWRHRARVRWNDGQGIPRAECGHHHQRPQPDDDHARGPGALLGVHRGLREVRPACEEVGQDRGRRREHLEDAGEIHGLQRSGPGERGGSESGRGEGARERAGDLG